MYGENSNVGHNHVRDHNDGMDVYIRKHFEKGSTRFLKPMMIKILFQGVIEAISLHNMIPWNTNLIRFLLPLKK